MNLYGNYEKWFSVEPPEIQSLKSRPIHEQAVEQIRDIYALIERDRGSLAGRFLDVDYELLCDDTHAVLRTIAGFLESNGVPVTGAGRVPESFEVKRTMRIDGKLYSNVKEYIDK